MRTKRISVCTVSMNRLDHIKQTLPVNIMQNRDYPDVEFILLDYNSADSLDDWVRTEMQTFIRQGALKYYRTNDPEYFHLSHAKNMAMKLASGDILCMIDADNFAGEGYLRWVASVFDQYGDLALITTLRKDRIPFRDQGGKICFHRNLLSLTNGFDEQLKLYGMDDMDFVNRLERAGGVRIYLEEERFLQYIGHSTEDRVRNQFLFARTIRLYVLFTGNMDKEKIVLYLFNDGGFFIVTYEFPEMAPDNYFLTYGGWLIGEEGQLDGIYRILADGLELTLGDGTALTMENTAEGNLISTVGETVSTWVVIEKTEPNFLEYIVAYGECVNRRKFVQNVIGCGKINAAGWGLGRVHLNFNNEKMIVL